MKNILKILRGIARHPLSSKRKLFYIKRFVLFQLRHLISNSPSIYKFVENSVLSVKKGMHGATGNIYNGLADFYEMAFVLHVLRKGDLFGDVGANVGTFSVLASVNAGANSIAIEPITRTYAQLCMNVLANKATPLIQTLMFGVGDKDGILKFINNYDTKNGVCLNQEQTENITEVIVKTLDGIFSERTPEVLKIDVEGYEWQVLIGAKTILEDNRLKAIIIETNNNSNAYDAGSNDIHGLLVSYGFHPYSYEPYSRHLRLLTQYQDTNTIYIRDIEWVKGRVINSRKYKVGGNLI